MQAIRTKFFGPSNSRGARIQAKCEAKTIFVGYDYELGVEGNHKAACEELVRKLGWDTKYYTPMVGGQFADAYYWVFTNDASGRDYRSPTTFEGEVQS